MRQQTLAQMYPDDDGESEEKSSKSSGDPLPKGWFQILDPNSPTSSLFIHRETKKIVRTLDKVFKKSPSPTNVVSGGLLPDRVPSFTTPVKGRKRKDGTVDKPIALSSGSSASGSEEEETREAILSEAESDMTNSQHASARKKRRVMTQLSEEVSEGDDDDDRDTL